jgi:hypothetical protein
MAQQKRAHKLIKIKEWNRMRGPGISYRRKAWRTKTK